MLCAIDAKDPEGRGQPHLGAGIVRIDLERAEQLAEGELLLVAYRLLGEDEDAVAVEGRLDLGKDFGRTGRVKSTPRTSAPSVG